MAERDENLGTAKGGARQEKKKDQPHRQIPEPAAEKLQGRPAWEKSIRKAGSPENFTKKYKVRKKQPQGGPRQAPGPEGA